MRYTTIYKFAGLLLLWVVYFIDLETTLLFVKKVNIFTLYFS